LNEKSEFADLIIRLDMLLTGKTREQAEHTARTSSRDLADPLSFIMDGDSEYYLSDGGYSRLVVTEEGKTWVTSNSLQRVKDAWGTPEAQALASAIGRAVAASVESYEASHSMRPGP